MRTHLPRRVALGALALLTTLTVVAPVQAGAPVRKLEPRRVVPYRVGGVFRPDTNVLSVSGYAAWMIDEALGPTTPLPAVGAAFLRAEREQGINARSFVAHAMLESGWGGSDIARLKRNLFGFNAYDRDPWGYASRYASHAKGIAAVAAAIRRSYLTPGGRWWYRFPTLRAMNRYYASDPRWADKVANIANILDRLVVTLRERGLRFRTPVVVGQPVAGAPMTLDVPWRARSGAVLPPAIRFAVRWTPLALVEASLDIPAAVPAPAWVLARRTDRSGRVARLAFGAPSLPGLWRLDVEARDSDGRPLPKADPAPIASLTLRVAAVGEATLALVAGDDGQLAATIRLIGPGAADVAAASTADPARDPGSAALEAWALPLDPAVDAYSLAWSPLPPTPADGALFTVPVPVPAEPAVVVVRIAGEPPAVGRTAPAAALVRRDADGRLTVTPLLIASPRDDLLLGRTPAVSRVTVGLLEEPGSLAVEVAAGDTAPARDDALAGVEETAGSPALLVRSLAAEPGREAGPLSALEALPDAGPAAARLTFAGLPAGLRLVMAGLVPPDGGPVDPATLTLAWIAVAAVPGAVNAPE